MQRWTVATAGVLLAAAAAVAAPPGPLDGLNIPTDFASETELAVQTNRTGFGDQILDSGAFTAGSEANALHLAKDTDYLYVGVTGNLEENGNAMLIFIGVDDFFFIGQPDELRADCVGGPPFSVQDLSREVLFNTNGTPGDDTDDTVAGFGSNGTILPCKTDYIYAADTFGGTLSISEYQLFDPLFGAVGQDDCTPNNPNDPLQDVYATRTFIGQSPTNDNNDVLENPNVAFGPSGFNNTNTTGVTEVDASNAAAANTGWEVAIPLSRFQTNPGDPGTLVNDLTIFVAVAANTDGNISSQLLPPASSADVCSNGAGDRPDLTTIISCLPVDISALPTFTGTAEGLIDPSEYGSTTTSTQTCQTNYGDQAFDPNAVTPSGGSELDALYVSNDDDFLYVGLTGNLERGGNTLSIFVDTDSDQAMDLGQSLLINTEFVPFQALRGLMDDTLPLDTDSNAVFYNISYGINLDGGNDNVYVDYWDLVNTNGDYRGASQRDSGDGTLMGGTNPNGLLVACNDTNSVGVIACDVGSNCYLETPSEVESRARTATKGFEIAIPLADLGIPSGSEGRVVKLWTFISSGGGFGSDQALPSLRNQEGPGNQVENTGDGPTAFTDPANPTPNRNYDARAACYTLQAGAACPKPGSGGACPQCDLNENGVTDGLDIAAITSSSNFGLAADAAADACADVDGSGIVSGLDVSACTSSACFGL